MCIWTSIPNLQKFQSFFTNVDSKQQDAPWLSLESPPSCHRSFSFSCPSVWPCWVEMYIHLLPTDPHLPPLASAWSDWRSPFNFKKSGRWFKRKKKRCKQQPVFCALPSPPRTNLIPSPLLWKLQSRAFCPSLPHTPSTTCIILLSLMALQLALSGRHRDYSKNRNFKMRLKYPVQSGKDSSVHCSSILQLSHLHPPSTLLQRETWIVFPPRVLD